MWVFTQDGFVSAVHGGREHPDRVVVRARDKQSLALLSELVDTPIIELDGRDYEYRVVITKEDFSNWLLMHVETLDYTNYKDRLWSSRGDVYHDAASRVWGEMHAVSDKYGYTLPQF
jgi:hypothetical protein